MIELNRVVVRIKVVRGLGAHPRMEYEGVVACSANRYGRTSRGSIGNDRPAVSIGCKVESSIEILESKISGMASITHSEHICCGIICLGKACGLIIDARQIDRVRMSEIRCGAAKPGN